MKNLHKINLINIIDMQTMNKKVKLQKNGKNQ